MMKIVIFSSVENHAKNFTNLALGSIAELLNNIYESFSIN